MPPRTRYTAALKGGYCPSHVDTRLENGKRVCEICSAYYKRRYRKLVSEGFCCSHPTIPVVPGQARCRECVQIKQLRDQILKQEVVDAYGGKCQCDCGCSESIIGFLTVDHTANNGAEHRKQIGRGIYRWLKTNNYPKDSFTILCYNCNCGRSRRDDKLCPRKIA